MAKIPPTTAEEDYLKAAVELENASNTGDYKRGNKAYERIMHAAKQIRVEQTDCGEKFFTSLLGHSMPNVVIVAAFNLIPLNPKLTRTKYKELAKGPTGEIRFGAEVTLEEWNAGRLDPNWFTKE